MEFALLFLAGSWIFFALISFCYLKKLVAQNERIAELEHWAKIRAKFIQNYRKEAALVETEFLALKNAHDDLRKACKALNAANR